MGNGPAYCSSGLENVYYFSHTEQYYTEVRRPSLRPTRLFPRKRSTVPIHGYSPNRTGLFEAFTKLLFLFSVPTNKINLYIYIYKNKNLYICIYMYIHKRYEKYTLFSFASASRGKQPMFSKHVCFRNDVCFFVVRVVPTALGPISSCRASETHGN